MYDDLSRIERCYGSVAEYYRCQEEDYEYEMEKKMAFFEKCKENKQKLKDNENIAVYFADNCVECEHYEEVGCTSYSDWDIDDVEHGLCHNCNRNECPVWKERNGD